MVKASDYVDGATVDWRALAATIIGGAVLAFYRNVIKVILDFWQELSGLIDGLAAWYALYVARSYSTPAVAISQSFAQLEQAIANAGVLGYLLAVVAIMALLYILEQGVRRLG